MLLLEYRLFILVSYKDIFYGREFGVGCEFSNFVRVRLMEFFF